MDAVLIVGCGDIGRRVARRYRQRDVPVTGLVRSEDSARQLRAAGVEPLVVDLDRPLPTLVARGTGLYYFAPPPPEGGTDPRLEAVLAACDEGNRPRRVVYISTTAVYGDCGGEWVSEEAPLRPGTARGRRRLAAERALQGWAAASGTPVVILRVPGIYGPGRLPLERLRKGLPLLKEEQSPFTNRIHAEDLADICLAAMERGEPGAVYNVSDGHPSNMTDYFNRIADRAGLPRPPVVDRSEAVEAITPGMLAFLQESKRIDNRRMLEGLGVRLRYPSLTEGLESCFAEGTETVL